MVAHAEDKLHTFVWRVLNFALPDDAVAWSAENRQNGMREGARRKARGCVPGVPDLHVTYAGRTLYIELKTETGRVSKEQRELHARLRRAGAVVAVCRSADAVLEFLRAEGVPVKAQVMA
ncbi:VRR-NUC domain-containing protein [Brytella acorum]|uniref:VRR-NUC domain-containing protein n=1 Tax=Brytella acorum TaxID=2959299 RepID=A0AA35V9R5_9PROT|nr:VRR-NUC domain-containing protein [Brytella acorum]CAI9119565.1 VRR-NUC domain-containing protein [Brytella acorum]